MEKKPLMSIRQWEKTPLHLAIEFVEEQLSQAGRAVLRSMIQQQANQHLPELSRPYVDHSLKVLIHGGFIRRCHNATGGLAYETTRLWGSRRELLESLKTPPYVKRFRPRNEEYRRAMSLGLSYPKPDDFATCGDLRSRENRLKRKATDAQLSLPFEAR